jgi:hypothetical protein
MGIGAQERRFGPASLLGGTGASMTKRLRTSVESVRSREMRAVASGMAVLLARIRGRRG